jgi:hypothetical protein
MRDGMNWARVGSRYINLANVIEIRFREMPLGTLRLAHIFFVGGANLELHDEEAEALRTQLVERLET